ncbi:MAG: type VI secretion system baseplate subunit TssG [Planctomycetaceae bacterium]
MAATGRRTSAAVIERLASEPYRFDFFQAVRLLELDDRAAKRKRIGEDHPPSEEAVRFRAHASQSFPPSPVVQVRLGETREERLETRDGDGDGEASRPALDSGPSPLDSTAPPEMVVAFFGLFGPVGALPQHYTRMVIERLKEKDPSLRDFFDLFHHRAVSLFFRAWAKSRLPESYERARLDPDAREPDLFTLALFSLVGRGMDGLRGRLDVQDETFLRYGGLFARQPRTAVALERMLEDFFDVSVRVLQFQGQWLHLAEGDQSRLPAAGRPRGWNNVLGESVIVGERVWDVQGRIRLRVGPLSYPQFRRFLPSGDRLRPFAQLVRSYVGMEFDFDVQLVLQADEVPGCRLGGADAEPSRLGWNTWLTSRPFTDNAADAVFAGEGRVVQ